MPATHILRAVLALATSSIILLSNNIALAAGGTFDVAVRAVGTSSATVGTGLTYTAEGYVLYCPSNGYYNNPTCSDGSPAVHSHDNAGAKIYISVSGSGNTLGGVQTAGSDTYVTIGADGTAQFTLNSSVAETKTITVQDAFKSRSATAGASFTAAPIPKTTTPTPAASTPTSTPAPPVAPTSGLALNSQPVSAATTPSFESGKSITLSGVTVPKGTITLYIFSTPRTATITADTSGKWTYQVADLEPGLHHVEAEVTDPATKLTSPRAQLAAFTVKSAATTTSAKKNPAWIWVVAAGVLLLLMVAGGIVMWLRHRRAARQASLALDPNSSQPAQKPLP
jgi:hypothetical protein